MLSFIASNWFTAYPDLNSRNNGGTTVAQKKWEDLTLKEKKTCIIGLAVVVLIAFSALGSLSNSKDVNFGAASTQSGGTTQQETATPTPTAPAGAAITLSQKNAVRSAKSYLSTGSFSYDGLVAQLEYEKFSTADATYGADNSGGDWNAQALKAAKSYQSSGSFSRQGLIDQLVYAKFTQEQATFGVDAIGL